MKKWLVLIALSLVALISFTTISKRIVKPIPTTTPSSKFDINLTINYGDENTNLYQVIAKEGDTAFSVLKSETEKQGIYLETQQYDFGVFVKKIGDLENGSKKAWIYYVNGISGDKAADLYTLKENETVLWKYETPKY